MDEDARDEHAPAPDGQVPWPDGPLTETELTELALSADPDAPPDPDALPMALYLGQEPGLLPEWYMPAPMLRRAGAWRVPVVLAIVGAFLIIEALGLCSTFGPVVPG